MRLLLISNSYSFDREYLDHVAQEIQDFFPRATTVMFLPFALHAHDSYVSLVRNRLGRLGYKVKSVHEESDPRKAVEEAEAFFVGGGNTFRLLKALYELDMVSLIRGRVIGGIPYMGSSAGTNVACPTIKTTNDMPIVAPPSLNALNLLPIQINPHYCDWDPECRAVMESREKRIMEYHEENDLPVLGLRDDCYIRIENKTALVKGTTNARLFKRGEAPVEIQPVGDISDLISQVVKKA